MPRLYIPRCGETITLKENWEFHLFNEYRNTSFIQAIGESNSGINYLSLIKVYEFKAGTELKIDRVYIRRTSGEYDFNSLTFCTKIGRKSFRFWAKLNDVNSMVIE